MKIFVRTDGKSFFIPLPNGLLSLALRLSPKFARRAAESESDGERADMDMLASFSKPIYRELARELQRARRDFGHLEIVHVLTADGDEVIITL